MLTGLFGLAVLIMKLWPATSIAGWLHRALVLLPLELVARVERKYLILIGLLMFGGQFIALLGPELALVYALDLSLYGEAIIATTLATAAVRLRSVWQKLEGHLAKAWRAISTRRARPRSRRLKARTASRKRGANDDDHVWAWSRQAA